MSKWDGSAPFDTTTGELVSYAGYHHNPMIYKTRDEARFTGELTYHGFARGRSSALLVFTDGTLVPNGHPDNKLPPKPKEFPFFMKTADEIVPLLVKGKLMGTFVPMKFGTNYAWRLEPTG